MKKEIKIIQEKISDKHNDSFWYDGIIAEFTKPNGTELNLIVAGEIKIYDKNGTLVYDCKERNGGIKGGLKNDDDLRKIGNCYNDNYYWEMNNWFEIVWKKKGEEYFDCDFGIVSYDYDEAIELLKSYIEDKEY